jgi:hypothetical protein
MSYSLLNSYIKNGAKLEEIKRYFENNTDTSKLEISKEYLIITNKNRYILIKEHINGFQESKLLTHKEASYWLHNLTLNDILYSMDCKGEVNTFKLKTKK